MPNNLTTRRSTYYQLSTELAHFDHEQLKTLVQDDQDPTHGWGVNRAITVGKSKIFVTQGATHFRVIVDEAPKF